MRWNSTFILYSRFINLAIMRRFQIVRKMASWMVSKLHACTVQQQEA